MNHVLEIDSNWRRTIILRTDHTLWITGSGFEPNMDMRLEPVLFYSNVRKAILEGATSYGGVLILTSDGRLVAYSRPLLNAPHEFMEITGLRDIIDISAASQQVYVLTSSGDVYGWGAHAGIYLGVAHDDFWVYEPTFIASDIEKILRGRMFIKKDGTLWIWGAIADIVDFKNSLGIDGGGTLRGDLVSYGTLPVAVLSNVHSADGISTHIIALDNTGGIYTWGSNFYGQLGDGSRLDRLTPTFIPPNLFH